MSRRPLSFVDVASGSNHILAVCEYGELYAWGGGCIAPLLLSSCPSLQISVGTQGQLGNGSDSSSPTPEKVFVRESDKPGARKVCHPSHTGQQCAACDGTPLRSGFQILFRSVYAGQNSSFAISNFGGTYSWGGKGVARVSCEKSMLQFQAQTTLTACWAMATLIPCTRQAPSQH